MKKIITLCSLVLLGLFAAHAQQTQTVVVQGIPRQVPVSELKLMRNVSLPAATLDAEKVRYFVGQGDSVSYMIVRFNDGVGMDNLVWGYRWSADQNPTGETMIRAIAKADPRFSAFLTASQFGAAIGGFAFDLNGNGLYLTTGSDTISIDSTGVIAAGSYRAFDAFKSLDASDHGRGGWYRGFWAYNITSSLSDAFHFASTGASGRKLKNGCADLWSFSGRGNNSYYYYVEPPAAGVSLPEEITLNLAENLSVPVLLQRGGGEVSNLVWTFGDANVVAGAESTADAPNGKLKLTEKTGTTTATLSANIGGTQYTSNTCTLNIVGPAVDLAGISFRNDTLDLKLGEVATNTLALQPSTASYPKIRYTSLNPDVAQVDSLTGSVWGKAAGATQVVATSAYYQGVSDTFAVVVNADYSGGLLIMNEGWFGHEGGSMNLLMLNDTAYSWAERVFAAQNPGGTLGTTTCNAVVYGGKLYLLSKQNYVTDSTTGGRLVVADAKTLKQLVSLDNIGGGDGRAVVGVNPNKVYLGTTAGIVPFNPETNSLGTAIAGTAGSSTYSGQIGEMLKAGRRVFALQQDKGILVIDAETDELEQTIANPDVQGIAETPDGKVWVALSNKLLKFDAQTLVVEDSVDVPAAATINCSWGAWVPASFVADTRSNTLYWNGGGSAWQGGSDYYSYTDGGAVTKIFSLTSVRPHDASKSQVPYGAMRFDSRTGSLVIPSTQSGWGNNYQYNWINIVDANTGNLKSSVPMSQAYWFPSQLVVPDNYAPACSLPSSIAMSADSTDAVRSYDLARFLSDKDNLKANIDAYISDLGDTLVVVPTISQGVLRLSPRKAGTSTFGLTVESNGLTTSYAINVTVDGKVGIETPRAEILFANDGKTLRVRGGHGWQVRIYTTDGMLLQSFVAANDESINLPEGIYIVRAQQGGRIVSHKILIK